jgi:aspartyl protease family protein
MFNVLIDYLPFEDELKVVLDTTSRTAEPIEPLFDAKDILQFQALVRKVPVAQDVASYAVRLVSATSEAAVMEIDGKRRSLGVGSQVISGNYATSSQPSVVLNADMAGHYYAEGSINGGPIRFMVDTGASMVSIGQSDARRLGIQYLSGERGMSNTANGLAPVYHVKLGEVRLGAITLRNVDGLVHESNDMPFALLGMSFLNRVDMRHSGQQLTLTRRF